MFVRNYYTTGTSSIPVGSTTNIDTSVLAFRAAIGTLAGIMAKSCIIHGIDWRTDFITTLVPTAGHGLIVSEAVYRDEVNASGGGIHAGVNFLTSNELGGSINEAQFPSRIAMRRSMYVDEAVGVPASTVINWTPLRVRTKVKLAIDDALWWRLELTNQATTGNWGVSFLAHAAVAYSVIT